MNNFDAWLRRTIDKDDPSQRFQPDEAAWLAAKALLDARPRRRRRAGWLVLSGFLLLLGIGAAVARFALTAKQPVLMPENAPARIAQSGGVPQNLSQKIENQGDVFKNKPDADQHVLHKNLPGRAKKDAVKKPGEAANVASKTVETALVLYVGVPDSNSNKLLEDSTLGASWRAMAVVVPLALRDICPESRPALPNPVRIASDRVVAAKHRGLTAAMNPGGFVVGVITRRPFGSWSVNTALQWRNQQRIEGEAAQSLETFRYGFGFEQTVESVRPVSAHGIEASVGASRQWRHHEAEAGLLLGYRLRVGGAKETRRRTSLAPDFSSISTSDGELPASSIQRWYPGVYTGYQYRFGYRWSVGAQLFYLPGSFWNTPGAQSATRPWQGMLGLRRYF